MSLDKAHGNQGMHDQILALKWIQSEIENFGGNPNNVTIMGESAGAMSCLLHYVSPLSRGLFHKIIAASGVWKFLKIFLKFYLLCMIDILGPFPIIEITRKYALREYILGVLTHTTAWD